MQLRLASRTTARASLFNCADTPEGGAYGSSSLNLFSGSCPHGMIPILYSS